MAPDDVQLLEYTEVSQEESVNLGTAAVLFPSSEAAAADQVDLSKISTLYVVDRCVSARVAAIFYSVSFLPSTALASSARHSQPVLDRCSLTWRATLARNS